MKKFLSLFAITALMLLALFGCSKEEAREPLTIAENGVCNYTIVRASKASEALISSTLTIKQAIKDNYSADVDLKDDWLNEKKGETPAECEILVGVSNREETATATEGLLSSDYVVKAVGKKIVIVGGSDAATIEGVKYFVENVCTSSDTQTLLFEPTDETEYRHEYNFSSLKIGGVDILEYKIVYDSSSAYGQERAVSVQTSIRDTSGKVIDIISDKDAETEYEILVGDTLRSASQTLISKYSRPNVYYTFAVEGSKLLIAFDGLRCGETAVKEFDTLLREQNGALDMTDSNTDYTGNILSAVTSDKADGTDVRAMTSNVLSHFYQQADDPYNKRMEILADTYLTYLPDVIGLQECRDVDFNALFPFISEYYGVVESAKVPQNPASNETIDYECSKILYRKDKFKYYDAEYEQLIFEFNGKILAQNMKTISSAVFENKQTGEKFIFVNSHFISSYGDEATDGHKNIRIQNATQFASKIERLRVEHPGLPIITTGDYFTPKNNAANAYPAYDIITGAGLADASVSAKKKMSPGMGTSHVVGTSVASTNIDMVFADTEKCDILSHRIITNIYTKDASDHFPVYADISFKS